MVAGAAQVLDLGGARDPVGEDGRVGVGAQGGLTGIEEFLETKLVAIPVR